jgi:hypothetical protein
MSSFKINNFSISGMDGVNSQAVFNAGKIGFINVDPNLSFNVEIINRKYYLIMRL